MYELLENRRPAVNPGHTDLVRAVFCDEFEAGVDNAALDSIDHGDIDRWVTDLRYTGLLLPDEVAAIERQWLTDPAGLVSALVGGLDEVTARRAAHHDARVSFTRRRSAAV